MIRRGKAAALALAAVLASGTIVALGRWEEHRSGREEVARMRVVLAAVGPLETAEATGYRFSR